MYQLSFFTAQIRHILLLISLVMMPLVTALGVVVLLTGMLPQWMKGAGFSPDTPVTVSVEQGRREIEPVRG